VSYVAVDPLLVLSSPAEFAPTKVPSQLVDRIVLIRQRAKVGGEMSCDEVAALLLYSTAGSALRV
jgi:hypothetical protein